MPVGRCPVLVERDDELNALSRLAGGGTAAIAVVTGEAGKGKSRLPRGRAAPPPPHPAPAARGGLRRLAARDRAGGAAAAGPRAPAGAARAIDRPRRRPRARPRRARGA